MQILTTKPATLPARSFKFSVIAVALFVVALIVSSCQLGESETPMQTPVTAKLPAPDEFVPLTTMPEMIEQAQPEYPKAAFDNDIQAAVWVKALILSDGTVHEALVEKSSGYTLLDNSAIMAAYKNKFKPGMIDNDPVACWVTYKVEFTIETKDHPDSKDFIPPTTMPEMIEQYKPEFPEEALKEHISGDVRIRALILADGTVQNVIIDQSSGNEMLDKAATLSAYKSKFSPGYANGEPVACWVSYVVSFSSTADGGMKVKEK